MDADQVLAFRLARSGLVARGVRGIAEAAPCPASDVARDAAVLALAARAEGLSREAYHHAVDAGDLVVAHVVRGAIHALAPGDLALYGRALIACDDGQLAAQLGHARGESLLGGETLDLLSEYPPPSLGGCFRRGSGRAVPHAARSCRASGRVRQRILRGRHHLVERLSRTDPPRPAVVVRAYRPS